MVTSWLRWTGQVDEVWLMPVASHAFGKDLASFEDRVEMCRAMGEVLGPWVRVCEIERELPPPNYTLYTLRALRDNHPQHQFHLVLGADNLAVVDRWHRWTELKAEFPPIVVGRQGSPSPEGTLEFPNVSSTEVRDRLRKGRSVRHLVLEEVRRRLAGLYTPVADASDGPPDAS